LLRAGINLRLAQVFAMLAGGDGSRFRWQLAAERYRKAFDLRHMASYHLSASDPICKEDMFFCANLETADLERAHLERAILRKTKGIPVDRLVGAGSPYASRTDSKLSKRIKNEYPSTAAKLSRNDLQDFLNFSPISCSLLKQAINKPKLLRKKIDCKITVSPKS
jgi:hypothetical protein